MNVIPDTPIWSMALRRKSPNQRIQNLFVRIVEEQKVVLPGIIKQELLSGIRSAEQFDQLNDLLAHFPEILATTADHVLAAKLFNKCQNSGIQGSHIDFLILALAINNSALVLTSDRDFQYYREHIPFELQFIAL